MPLESDVTVREVGERVGYSSEVAFSRAFKRVIGENPGRVKGRRAEPLIRHAPAQARHTKT
jgi:AraC-like DNA-binding protein